MLGKDRCQGMRRCCIGVGEQLCIAVSISLGWLRLFSIVVLCEFDSLGVMAFEK